MCRVREGEREEARAKAAKLGYFGNFFVTKKGNKKKIKLKKKILAVLFLIDKLVVYLSKKN